MLDQFDKINEALDRLEKTLESMKSENENLRGQIAELKSVIDDRDLEIMQLQEDAEKAAAANKSEKDEIDNRLEGLLGRMCKMVSEDQPQPSDAEQQ